MSSNSSCKDLPWWKRRRNIVGFSLFSILAWMMLSVVVDWTESRVVRNHLWGSPSRKDGSMRTSSSSSSLREATLHAKQVSSDNDPRTIMLRYQQYNAQHFSIPNRKSAVVEAESLPRRYCHGNDTSCTTAAAASVSAHAALVLQMLNQCLWAIVTNRTLYVREWNHATIGSQTSAVLIDHDHHCTVEHCGGMTEDHTSSTTTTTTPSWPPQMQSWIHRYRSNHSGTSATDDDDDTDTGVVVRIPIDTQRERYDRQHDFVSFDYHDPLTTSVVQTVEAANNNNPNTERSIDDDDDDFLLDLIWTQHALGTSRGAWYIQNMDAKHRGLAGRLYGNGSAYLFGMLYRACFESSTTDTVEQGASGNDNREDDYSFRVVVTDPMSDAALQACLEPWIRQQQASSHDQTCHVQRLSTSHSQLLDHTMAIPNTNKQCSVTHANHSFANDFHVATTRRIDAVIGDPNRPTFRLMQAVAEYDNRVASLSTPQHHQQRKWPHGRRLIRRYNYVPPKGGTVNDAIGDEAVLSCEVPMRENEAA